MPENRMAIILTEIVEICDFRQNFSHIARGVGIFYIDAARVYDSVGVRISSRISDPKTPTLHARSIAKSERERYSTPPTIGNMGCFDPFSRIPETGKR